MSEVLTLLVFAVLLVACLDDDDDEPPTCAELGCPSAPSGSRDAWTPCVHGRCYCHVPDHVLACEAR